MSAAFPFGECECRNGCSCQASPGPAAYEVTRGGQPMRVCTRCDLNSDEPTRKPLFGQNTPVGVFREYDSLGLFCLLEQYTLEPEVPS